MSGISTLPDRPKAAAAHFEGTHLLPMLGRPESIALAAILAVAALLDFVNLGRIGWGNTYYAASVRSMLQSWHNFFFVSFDPGGFVTVDKPPAGFWLQTLSAKLFGSTAGRFSCRRRWPASPRCWSSTCWCAKPSVRSPG
jgi:hypothetical protein